jgi:hypothetical protein
VLPQGLLVLDAEEPTLLEVAASRLAKGGPRHALFQHT